MVTFPIRVNEPCQIIVLEEKKRQEKILGNGINNTKLVVYVMPVRLLAQVEQNSTKQKQEQTYFGGDMVIENCL